MNTLHNQAFADYILLITVLQALYRLHTDNQSQCQLKRNKTFLKYI